MMRKGTLRVEKKTRRFLGNNKKLMRKKISNTTGDREEKNPSALIYKRGPEGWDQQLSKKKTALQTGEGESGHKPPGRYKGGTQSDDGGR